VLFEPAFSALTADSRFTDLAAYWLEDFSLQG
jgi:hypothetical protein